MKHVRDQNWFAVSLDFLIVVVGVFIGIQVANWNEERAEDDLADRYRVQLMEDIRSDIADIDVGYRTSEWRLAALTELLERAGAPTLDTTYLPERELTLPRPAVENDSITYLMNASTYTRFLDNDQPTYASLVNAGNARQFGRPKTACCCSGPNWQARSTMRASRTPVIFQRPKRSTEWRAMPGCSRRCPATGCGCSTTWSFWKSSETRRCYCSRPSRRTRSAASSTRTRCDPAPPQRRASPPGLGHGAC